MQRLHSAVFLLALGVLAGCSAHSVDRSPGAISETAPKAIQGELNHPVTLDFAGPNVSETDAVNPFLDYRLAVIFTHKDGQKTIRGFYAADGNAAETGADSGNVWRVHFAPERTGEWRYSAVLRRGSGIALAKATDAGEIVPLAKAQGRVVVSENARGPVDFKDRGFLRQHGRYFRFSTGDYWLKGGTNSPENMLGFAGFDNTYRIAEQSRDGEAESGSTLHQFAPHIRDWRPGDPSWKGGKGKGLVGLVNYLADQGMNAAYLLTMNVDGDGNDVWPWRDPSDLTRFDVSKLAQWDIVFEAMQGKGVLIHLVTQETENEFMLDGGETGPMRQLYYHELIARFAHHPALVWNLGEENGPVHWRPEGQNDAQRKAMADFFAENDPYGHPILLHTHAEAADKDALLTPLLGHASLNGLSFQVSDPAQAAAETRKWLALAKHSGRPWMITMDEIGPWQVGAKADVDDPSHDTLRRTALWGTLLAGGAGVEWYFGAHQKGNDLTTEDLRSRAELWRQTRIALQFFEEHLPYWEMAPCKNTATDCLVKPGSMLAAYVPAGKAVDIAAYLTGGSWELYWFDPVSGRALSGAQRSESGSPPNAPIPPDMQRDWVLLAKNTGNGAK